MVRNANLWTLATVNNANNNNNRNIVAPVINITVERGA